MRSGWEEVTAHTLRHTFGSMANELGYSELTIVAMLGHAASSVTSRYIHRDEAVQSAVERVATEIARRLDGDAAKAAPTRNVFSIGAPSLLVGGFSGVGLVSIRQSAAGATPRL